MKKRLLIKLIAGIVLIFSTMFVAACNGVVIKHNDDGSIVVIPNDNGNISDAPNGDQTGNNNSGNQDNDGNVIDPDDKSDLHIHVYELVETDENSAATCTSEGTQVWRCDCGDEFVEHKTALGHDIRSYQGKSATCTEDGYMPYEKCIRGNCDYSTYEVIPAVGHQFNSLPDIEATCTSDGFVERVECSAEGCSFYTETIVAALGHMRSTIEGCPPTCTEDGYTSYDVCIRDGCTDTMFETPGIIPALGHDNVDYEAKEPTCTDFGWLAYSVCQRCSHSSYQQIDATGHTFNNGYCDCGYADLGLHEHMWGYGYVISGATCIDSGTMGYVCTDAHCGDTKTEIIPALGHDNELYPAKEATCTSEGWYAYTECKRCGYSTFESVPKRAHNYSGVVTTQPTCTLPGIRTYTCSCGNTYQTEIQKLGHDWGSWYTTKDATCDASGQEQRVCMSNSAHVDTRTLPKLGHSWGEWIMLSEPTCSQQGQEQRICISNSAHIEIRGIPTTAHVENVTTGLCTQCGKQLSYQLAAPTISSVSVDSGMIYWNTVEGADHYEVSIEPSGDYGVTDQTCINLEKFYGTNTQLKVKIRAIPIDTSPLMASSYCEYVFEIPGQPIINSAGIGGAVNLLTGSYTTPVSGATRIFNEVLFNRLRVSEYEMKDQYSESIYKDNLYEYVEGLSTSIGEKVNMSTSVGVDKIANITSGYTFEIEDNYEKQTQSQTKAIFYDLNYLYAYKNVEIYGYKDTQKLSSILSDEFKADAAKVQNYEMTPEKFIIKYGTHIITAATYGATFNLHYEMISNDGSIQDAFGTNVEAGIKNQLSATLHGIDIDAEMGTTTNTSYKAMSTFSNASTYAKFVMRSSGGNATEDIATSLSDFAGAFESWSAGLDDSGDYVVIDVPDNSLYFVWDFLGEEYSEAKQILYKYFYSCCDEQYYAIKDKISDMYKDSLTFDEETGTLTVNFSGLQNYTSASLEGIKYIVDGNVWFDSDSNTGVFTVFSKYNGMDVKKVIFEGSYFTEDLIRGGLIGTKFTNLSIYFDECWDDDIVIEFRNFAYIAGIGKSGLDFSATLSRNISIIVTGTSYIIGGEGQNTNGQMGINAAGRNLTLSGLGQLVIEGGNAGKSGGTLHGQIGGTGISAEKLLVDDLHLLIVHGGNGSNGSNGAGQQIGNIGGAAPWTYTTNGGNGGNGGIALDCSSLTVSDKSDVCLYGGDGADGGKGGSVIGSGNYDDYADLPDAASGGNGGNGGSPINSSATIVLYHLGSLELMYGNGGDGGNGGNGGDAWFQDNAYPDGKSHGGNGGNGGYGYNGGNGGLGGNGGGSYANLYWMVSLIGTTGDGGYGGAGGNSISKISYYNGVANISYGTSGVGRRGGSPGGLTHPTEGSRGPTIGADRYYIIGSAGQQVLCQFNIDII